MQLEHLQGHIDVSRETYESLQTFHSILLKWQKQINLISPGTVNSVWERHILDSLQLASFIPDHVNVIADLGSGGGFPGLVLALAQPGLTVHLIESDQKKAQFLRTVSRETNAGALVHNKRIDEVLAQLDPFPHMVTARALAPLRDILDYSVPYLYVQPLEMLFLKGARFEEEIKEAERYYDFSLKVYDSITHEQGKILHIKDLSKKPGCV